ncbi:hypothetical protein [Nonomuraea sp. NPDC049480]|uniref:hypothetical protein n=1 Tax=Nonomuraea sp. NPDC049480 TaxID=3364353 RepID=UPI0037A9BE11
MPSLPLLFAGHNPAAELNDFARDMSRSAGFVPSSYPGTVTRVRGACDLVVRGRCVFCLPQSGTERTGRQALA